MAAVIVNFRQVSPVNFWFGLVDKFDHPTSRTVAQGLEFDESFCLPGSSDVSLIKLLTYVPNRAW